MDRKTAIDLVRQFSWLIVKVLPVSRIVLYGSHARGNAHPESDIDVAVIVDQLKGDFLELQTTLFRLRRDIDLRIEPILLEEGSDAGGFIKEVLSTGVQIYPL